MSQTNKTREASSASDRSDTADEEELVENVTIQQLAELLVGMSDDDKERPSSSTSISEEVIDLANDYELRKQYNVALMQQKGATSSFLPNRYTPGHGRDIPPIMEWPDHYTRDGNFYHFTRRGYTTTYLRVKQDTGNAGSHSRKPCTTTQQPGMINTHLPLKTKQKIPEKLSSGCTTTQKPRVVNTHLPLQTKQKIPEKLASGGTTTQKPRVVNTHFPLQTKQKIPEKLDSGCTTTQKPRVVNTHHPLQTKQKIPEKLASGGLQLLSRTCPKEFNRQVRERRKRRKIECAKDGTVKVVDKVPQFWRQKSNAGLGDQKPRPTGPPETECDIYMGPDVRDEPLVIEQPTLTETQPTLTETDTALQPPHQHETILSEEESYSNLLASQESGVVRLDNSVLAIMKMQSDGKGSRKLKVKDYVYIIKVEQSVICSCDADGMKLLLSLEDLTIPIDHQKTDCLHIRISEKIKDLDLVCWKERLVMLEEDYDHSYGGCMNSGEQMFPLSSDVVGVYCDGEFATVYAKSKRFMCSCPEHRGECKFIKVVQKALKQENLPDFLAVLQDHLDQRTASYRPTMQQISHSTQSIQLTKEHSTDGTQETQPTHPPQLKCQSCGGDMKELREEVPCFRLLTVDKLVVPYRQCEDCGRDVITDGYDLEIVNMGDYVVTHELMRDYLKLYLGDGLTLHSYYRKWYWSVRERKGCTDVCSYSRFRVAWLSFISLLELSDDVYSCTICGTQPDVIVCDGITLAFQKKHRATLEEDSSPSHPLSGYKYTDTLLVPLLSSRKLLSTLETVDHSTLESSTNLPKCIKDCLVYLSEAEEMPRHWLTFLKDLATSSPITSYINSVQVLDSYITEQTHGKVSHSTMKALQEESPVLFLFLVKATPQDREVSLGIFQQLLCLISKLRLAEPHQLPAPVVSTKLEYYPSLPSQTVRGCYSLDKTKDPLPCRKKGKTQKTLLPGIFLMHCQHGINYGFSVMDNGESPNDPFTVLRTRFTEAPGVVVYDNACNLQRYCVGRDPGFFKETKFFVDKMHWWNHTGCSRGYNIRLYTSRYSAINTQMAEQRNSYLLRLKTMLSYMTQENFMSHLKLFMWFRNRLISVSNSDRDQIYRDISMLYTKL